MKPEEIMIGDYIQVNGEACKVISISYFDIGISDSKEDFYHEHIDNIKPISLTSEFLEKNGFTGGEYISYTGDVWYLKQEGFVELGLTISHNTAILWGKKKLGYPYSSWNNFLISNIHSVHELQHALRLCGVEKKIEI